MQASLQICLALAKACSAGGYSLLLLGALALLPALPVSQEIGVFAETFAQLDAGAQLTLAASAIGVQSHTAAANPAASIMPPLPPLGHVLCGTRR